MAPKKKKPGKERVVTETSTEETTEYPIVDQAMGIAAEFISQLYEEAPPEYEFRVIWVQNLEEKWAVYLGTSIDDNMRYLVTHTHADGVTTVKQIDDGPIAVKEL
jgi:hypothetical protein